MTENSLPYLLPAIAYTIKVPSGTVVIKLRFVTKNLFQLKNLVNHNIYE